MVNNFRTYRIRKKLPPPKGKTFSSLKKPGVQSSILIFLIIIVSGFVIFEGISALNVSSFFSFLSGSIGKELQTDENGRTNIILLGAAGEGFDGKLLTDSIMLVSLNHREKKASLFSLPRDLYVETKETGGNRINLLYALGEEKLGESEGLEFTRFTIENLFDIPIHYSAKLDFKGFEKIIDAIGGIEITVPETINDPFYPKDGTYDYERFYLPAGSQRLDGKTALKYVRSRHTSSDFLRGKRQQDVLLAIREKTLDEGILRSASELKAIYRLLREHLETNMDLREMISLARLASKSEKDLVFHFTIHDDPTVSGGFLYTPLRELYGGAFVLLPASDSFSEVKRYTKLIIEKPEWLQENLSVQILNGTKRSGVAGSMKVILKRYGFSVPRFGNAKSQDLESTTLYVRHPEAEGAISIFENLFPGITVSSEIPQKYLEEAYASDTDVILELGKNSLPIFDNLDVFRNVVPLTPSEPPTIPSDSSPAPNA